MIFTHRPLFAVKSFRSSCRTLLKGLALLFVATTAFAQWQTQDIVLQPGWNAVYLEIQPGAPRCEEAFAGMPVESVWLWNSRFSSVQFLQDPDKLLPKAPDWLAFSQNDAGGRTLHTLRGGDSYLIKVSGAAAITWHVTGQPLLRAKSWRANSYNFVGFEIDAGQAPTFANFFQGSAAHRDQPIYRLNAAGKWERVTNAAATTLRRGEAFWVYTKGDSRFNGPLEILAETGETLQFGRLLTEATVHLKNNSPAAVTVSLAVGASGAPAGVEHPALAGAVPLSYWNLDLANGVYAWTKLVSTLNVPLAPGEQRTIRFAVRRPDMAAYSPGPGVSEYLYQSVLAVTDGAGSRVSVPVTAKGVGGGLAQSISKKGAAAAPRSQYAGLWVGSVDVTGVSQPADISNPNVPQPANSGLNFRIILHVDANGVARLLQQAIFMWQTNSPGHYVIVTDDSKVSQFEGPIERDGKSIGRRISSVAYGLPSPLQMAGSFAIGESLTCRISMGFDDPLNPFKHRYHPDHNNLDARYESVIREAYDIDRAVSLTFNATDPESLPSAGWGDDQMGGPYLETITGIHKQAIYIKGVARLRRVSPIAVLNDGQP